MAQEVHLMGATYSDVPSILLPDSSSTLHQFTDVTGTTATASDVASGKIFYTAAGVQTTGTGSGGGVDGDNLGYGLALIGYAKVGSAVIVP